MMKDGSLLVFDLREAFNACDLALPRSPGKLRRRGRRNEQRSVLHHLHVDGPTAVFVVLQKAGEKRLLGFYAAVLVQFSRR